MNALASKFIFRSGFSVEKGLTYKLEQKIVGNTKFCDTPGLSDVKQKEEAGAAIRDSLNMGGPLKILFFCKLDDGRVRMSDLTTMRLVNDAAKEIGSNYGLIVNKIPKKAYKKIQNQHEIEQQLREALSTGIQRTSNVLFLPVIDDLDEEENALVSLDKLSGLQKFIEEVPTITLTPCNVQHIRVEQFDFIMKELENLKSSNEKLKKDIEKLKMERETVIDTRGNFHKTKQYLA